MTLFGTRCGGKSLSTGHPMMRRAAIFLMAVGSAALMTLFPACGKKAPPFLPDKRVTSKVVDLTGKWEGGQIRLQGSIQAGDDNGPPVTGCTIYQAWYPPNNPPCEGCPIQMKALPDNPQCTVSGARVSGVVPADEKPGIWFFEVRLTGSGGAEGPPSQRIRLNVEN